MAAKRPGLATPWLVGYYGVFQALHVVFNVLCLSGLRPIPEFPWPPAEGWHPQATAFFTATGLIDTVIALLALYFVAIPLAVLFVVVVRDGRASPHGS